MPERCTSSCWICVSVLSCCSRHRAAVIMDVSHRRHLFLTAGGLLQVYLDTVTGYFIIVFICRVVRKLIINARLAIPVRFLYLHQSGLAGGIIFSTCLFCPFICSFVANCVIQSSAENNILKQINQFWCKLAHM